MILNKYIGSNLFLIILFCLGGLNVSAQNQTILIFDPHQVSTNFQDSFHQISSDSFCIVNTLDENINNFDALFLFTGYHSEEIDTLYYLPDSTIFISDYLIADEIYNIHTRFEPQTGWESYKIKEIHFLFSTMVIGEPWNEVRFFKDTLSTLIYSQPVGIILDSSDVYPNWYKLNISDNFPAISGIVEVPIYVFDLFSLCITEQSYSSGHTIGFYENSQSWRFASDRPIKLIIERLVSGTENESNQVSDYKLYQNYPNPFNPSTRIEYEIPEVSFVTVKVYDVLGNEVATLVNEEKPAGTYQVEWDASRFPSGVYFYQLRTGTLVDTKKMVLLR